ncbi:MFS transporter [Candidatus Tisiphia endosymbiont of Thecophora atra]|uniref:MFS transporter n=1 Tax=Candidatus Tisiphia endosymbiont of Thecophora atra TaxID=3066258 RepID=UPI00312CC0B3
MIGYQQEQRSLTKEQKEAVGLLSIGTFLESFDLMLYIHMAVLLNELFFPQSDPHTTAIYSATAFCSTFVFRPVGALIFGYIGDNVGRKATVIVTTFMMALACFLMAILPTYAEIGLTATILITMCRILQGLSSLGEETGAELYLTEMTKPPLRYPVVALINVFSTVGMVGSLGVASLVMSFGVNWRYAFLFGMVVAFIGSIARTALRETPEFADAKRRVTTTFNESNENIESLKGHPIWKEKVYWKTYLAYFLIQCAWPVIVYFVYIYCTNILKDSFHYTSTQIIVHNFIISIVHLLCSIVLVYLSYKTYPLKILNKIFMLFVIVALCLPFFLSNMHTSFHLLLIQILCICFGPKQTPAIPIFLKHFPVLKRFTYSSITFALSRAFMYVIVSFGLVYLMEFFGSYGLFFILIPICVGYKWGINHFSRLEKSIIGS